MVSSLLFRAQRHGEDCEDGWEDDWESGRAAHSGSPAAGRDSGPVCSHPGIEYNTPFLHRDTPCMLRGGCVEEMVNFTKVNLPSGDNGFPFPLGNLLNFKQNCTLLV